MEPSAQHTDDARDQAFDPFPWYEQMRRDAPAWVDHTSGVLSVFRYDDVQRALSDYEAFSSDRSPRDASSALNASLISSDPPRHRQLRNLVTQAFTPRAIAQLAPRITAIIDGLLDPVAAAGRMDFVADLADPLPVIVIAEMLGIPISERVQFKRWSDAIVATTDGGLTFMEAQREMARYFSGLIAERAAEPRDDLISHLITAEIDGERLTPDELASFFILLVVAGNETTRNAISWGLHLLTEHPEQRQIWLADLDGVTPTAVEEIVRWASPVIFMRRTLAVDTVLGGQAMRAGDKVAMFYWAANRDPAHFTAPDAFDVRRTPNHHVGFGGPGPHFCLGAHLARREMTVMFRELLTRAPEVHATAAPRRLQSMFINGIKELPVALY